MMRGPDWVLRIVVLLALLGAAATVFAQRPEEQPTAQPMDYRLTARSLAEGVYVVAGVNADFAPSNGCNIINTGFIVGDDGVLVINTGPSRRYGEQLRALIARTTPKPLRQVIHLNQHPDYFLGNQAFADVPRAATALTRAGMQREAQAYEDNLYRMCGDWMAGTQALLPDTPLAAGPLPLAGRDIVLAELAGHTASDLVLLDRRSGIAFAGGLVFRQRIPTTPHADIPRWLASLDALAALPARVVVPSHGPVMADSQSIGDTRRYLRWLDGHLRESATVGRDMGDLLRIGLPPEYRGWAAADTEYLRSLAHLFARYEQAVLLPLR